MKSAAPDPVIFDIDDVVCRYDLGKRLRVLSSFSGRSPRDITSRQALEREVRLLGLLD
jgi:hypothetical protein